MTPDASAGHGLGAIRVGPTDWSFVVWAPLHETVSVAVVTDGECVTHQLTPAPRGYHRGVVEGAGVAPDYRFVVSDGTELADPASRWQPDGVHGPSRGFDPTEFVWTDHGFVAPGLAATVIYELHVGTFTPEGTFDAAIGRLGDLAELGVSTIEPMPINAFPGGRNWGYDGVFPYAAQEAYGGPRAFQRFVDACHAHGLAVMLDVVYNHLGPEGNVLGDFGPYFTDVYATPWGSAVNVAEAGSDEVRRYFTDNALMWLRDFHVDGLRLDAIHGIVDPTASPFLRELTTAVGELAVHVDRTMVLVAESADNNPLVVSAGEVGGLGFDGQWNDDFHHALHVALTGEREGYYADYSGLDDLARSISDGFVYQGDYSAFRDRRHGVPSRSVPSDHLVSFAQNHDQVGNRAGAERLVSLVPAPMARLAAAILLLAPAVPLLFMGEEYGEIAPFPYFIDHGDPALVEAVRKGRAEEFGRGGDTFDPAAVETFAAARLDWSRRDGADGQARLALHRALLACRREHPAVTEPRPVEVTAIVAGDALVTVRRARADAAFAAFNVSARPAEITVPRAAADWQLDLDSTLPALGGSGEGIPATVRAGEALTLPAYGFCLYTPQGDEH